MSDTSSTSPSPFNLDALILEFTYPFDKYQLHQVETQKEADVELENIELKLKESSWNIKVEAFNHLFELLKGGIQYYNGGNLSALAPLISQSLNDNRPKLIKISALLIAGEAQMLEEKFEPSFEYFYSGLLKNLTSSNQMVSNSCHLALIQIMKYCTTVKIGITILGNANSDIPANRQVAAEMFHIATETWPRNVLNRISKAMHNTAAILGDDQIASIKFIIQSALSINRTDSPNKLSRKKIPSTLDYMPTLAIKSGKQAESILRSNPNSPKSPSSRGSSNHSIMNSPRSFISQDNQSLCSYPESLQPVPPVDSSITDFLPPINSIEARYFKYHLDKLIMNNQINQIDNTNNVFINSLVDAFKFLPKFELWKNNLLFLYSKFKENLDSQMIPILKIFGFCDDSLALAEKEVGLQNIAETFIGKEILSKDSFNFFVSVFRTGKYNIILDDKLRELLNILIKHFKTDENIKYLNNALIEDSADIPGITHLLLLNISRNENFSSNLTKLEKVFIGSQRQIKEIEDIFDVALPEIINKGNDQQIMSTIYFIIQASNKLKKVSFKTSFFPLLTFLKNNEDHPLFQPGMDCLGIMMNDMKTLVLSIEILENNKEYEFLIIEAMYIFISQTSPQRVLMTHEVLVQKLQPYIKSDDPRIRRNTIGIFAEFKKKIPKEFNYQLQKHFTSPQKRMIEMRSSELKK